MAKMHLFKVVWRKWLPLARIIGNFQGQVILTFFYLVILGPLALFLKIFGDPLGIRIKRRSSFEKWSHPEENLESARKQY